MSGPRTARRDPLAGGEPAAFEGLDAIEAAQVRRCVRVLLRRPLLRAEGPDGETLSAVRRYADRLQTLFAAYLGYRLVVEPGFARLYKTGRTPDGVRGAHKPNGAAFTPRAYAYLALVLAVLTGGGGQLLLSSLVAEVRAAGAEAGLDLGTGIVDRRALAAALRHLIDLGVLAETDGSVSPWAEDADREALLTVDAELLGHLVAAPLGRHASPEALAGAVEDAGAEGGPAPADERHAVRRRLVEDPVVLLAALPAAQRDWLRANLRAEAHLLEELTGLRMEVRAEGVLAVDPEGYLTDRVFPGTGTVARIALLAAAELLADPGAGRTGPKSAAGDAEGDGEGAEPSPGAAGGASESEPPGEPVEPVEPTEDGWTPVAPGRLRAVAAAIAERYPRAWSREAVRDTGRLAESVAHALAQAGLARVRPGGAVELNPAAARYRPVPDGPAGEDPGSGEAAEDARAGAASRGAPRPAEGQDALFGF
ncbi:TIGR02678 family protein [Streptomonospora sp. S1-112]|uniref:TIGR02678 family protein n=1 Tax=Streptomonospora mangrovi TaxID=2883123 RepID=A0A9X3SF51_9ACTN|nr:TIGR02678 family protein [Streptomonospora mangrovi]MDA0566563.1 TIGR02678 family protein [Streptomonospora mangrovi]